jgi:hypothetical protein
MLSVTEKDIDKTKECIFVIGLLSVIHVNFICDSFYVQPQDS